MAHHRGRGILFGGVHDVEDSEEGIDSEFFDQLFPRVSKFLRESFILWMVGMQMNHNSLRRTEELHITLLTLGGAHPEEDDMLTTKSFSIIAMHF